MTTEPIERPLIVDDRDEEVEEGDDAPPEEVQLLGSRRREGRLLPQLFISLAATFGSLLMGTCIGWSGPAISLMRNSSSSAIVVNDETATWIASLMPLGAVFGGPLAGYVIDRQGRKLCMLVTSLGYAISMLLILVAQNVAMILVGRFLNGVCAGITSVVVPLYISEAVETRVRGAFGSLFQFNVTFGVFYVSALGLTNSWVWMTAMCILVAAIWAVCLMFVPETPAYLILKGKMGEARKSLTRLRGISDNEIEEEIAEIDNAVQVRLTQEKPKLIDLVRKRSLRQPLVISILLMVGQQLSGVNAVLFFSVDIFEAAGTNLNSFVENLAMTSVMLIATLISLFIIDRAGRRLLLIFSALFMALAQVSLGYYFYVSNTNPAEAKAISFLPVLSICVFVMSFSIGFGPIPWLMLGELFSPLAKEKCGTIGAGVNWFLAFLVTQFFVRFVRFFGKPATFWFFGGVLVAMLLFSCLFVPETKGKSLEEIQREYFSSSHGDNDRNESLVDNEEINVDRPHQA